MKNEHFNFFMPVEFEKAGEGTSRYKNMIIGGVASTNDEDLDQEILEPDGFNLNILKTKGTINWEHQAKNSASNVIGEPIEAEVKNNKLFLKAKLYEKMAKARDAYDTMLGMKESGATRHFGFSIEGTPLQRDPRNPKRITKALITNIALCMLPKNSNTFAEIVKGVQTEDFIKPQYDIPDDIPYLYKGVFGNNEYTLHKDFTITKAMCAGVKTGQQLVGENTSGAALKKESLDPDLKILTMPVETVQYAADNWDDFQEATKKALRKGLHDQLIKGGEGSRGGRIIGHTKSGKPVYAKQSDSDQEMK